VELQFLLWKISVEKLVLFSCERRNLAAKIALYGIRGVDFPFTKSLLKDLKKKPTPQFHIS
jgi:hypothetical protein